MKGQGRALTFLTWQQRLEFVRATWRRWNGVHWVPGYLSDLEVEWQRTGADYPLIPGGNIPRSGVIRPGRVRPVSNMSSVTGSERPSMPPASTMLSGGAGTAFGARGPT